MKALLPRFTMIISTLVFAVAIANSIQPVLEDSIPSAKTSVTEHSITVDGKSVPYTATAGTMTLRDEENKPIALHGFTYYKVDQDNSSERPIVFAFNGGPGSSSIWLHMGVLGPRRTVVVDPGFTPAAPYRMEDNEYSIIDVADLVMMDPVGTGLSHAIGEAKNKDFWGVDQDARAISLFIKQFISEHKRWDSPKYLLGESYGTLRNAAVMDYLQNRLGMSMNGVIMVSAVFDLRTLAFAEGDDISYLMNFPTYAATAWYHDKVPGKPEDLFTFLDEVRSFTEGEYASALMKGDRLTEEELSSVLDKLSYYSGLDKDYLDRANLRVTQGEFCQELLRKEGLTVGRLDSRFTGINQDELTQRTQYDPQSSAISPAYTATFMRYMHEELEMDPTDYYHVSAYAREGFEWDWKHGRSGWFPLPVNTGVDMARAMSKNPNMKVLVLNGIYDAATPFYGVEYSIDHLGLEPEIKENIIMEYYEAGHMMYTHRPSLQKFKKDVANFINDTKGTSRS